MGEPGGEPGNKMDFTTLSLEQKQLLELASDFAKREILPHAATLDANGQFPREIFKKALEAGLLNVLIPEEYGGVDMHRLDMAMMTETLGRACVGITAALSLNNLMSEVLLVAGNVDQKKKYFGLLREGAIGCYAVTEPGAGSNVAGLETTAASHGSDYVLNGTKTWISNATEGNFFIVFAKTDPAAGHKGLSAFFVDRDTKGLSIGKKLTKMGQRAFPASEVILNEVKVDKSRLIGRPGDGFFIAMKAFDGSRPMVGAVATGLAQRCLDEAILYAKARETMGKPIMIHQMVASKIAEMGMRVHASRLLAFEAADRLDRGLNNTLQSSYAKAFCSDTAVFCSSEALQIHGGMGYSTEFPVEKLYRDAKVLQIYEGTNEIQRLIMAKELCK
jgi:acyl-CoA dehydrogenase